MRIAVLPHAALALLSVLAGGCQLVAGLPDPAELCLVNDDCGDPAKFACVGGKCQTLESLRCHPRCEAEGRVCGPDGCGGFCGRCGSFEVCAQGRCVLDCNVEGGACDAGFSCDETAGQCRCGDDAQCYGGHGLCRDGSCVECDTSGPDDRCGLMPCIDGVCQRCASGDDCAERSRPVCEAGKCRGCRGDGDCAGHPDGGICNGDGRCGACRAERGCPAGQICDLAALKCQQAKTCQKRGQLDPGCTAEAPACDGSGRCARCLDTLPPGENGCPDGQPCNGGRCAGCGSDAECADPTPKCAPDLKLCVRPCSTIAECSGTATPVCRLPPGHCAACEPGKPCALPGGGTGSCDAVGFCRRECVPGTCDSLGLDCGEGTDGCGGPLDCGTCGGDDTCIANACVDVDDALGENCLSDADCTARSPGFGCLAAVFPGTALLAQRPGYCAPARGAGCASGFVERTSLGGVKVCAPACSTDSGCDGVSPDTFCASDPLDPGRRFCQAGCRLGECPTGEACDPYWRHCRTSHVNGTTTTDCPTQGCPENTACLPSTFSGGVRGVCTTPCSGSGSTCVCLHGATGEGGACQQPAHQTPSSTCEYDADCHAGAVCAPSDHRCRMACATATGRTLVGDQACSATAPCSQAERGWNELGRSVGMCLPDAPPPPDWCQSGATEICDFCDNAAQGVDQMPAPAVPTAKLTGSFGAGDGPVVAPLEGGGFVALFLAPAGSGVGLEVRAQVLRPGTTPVVHQIVATPPCDRGLTGAPRGLALAGPVTGPSVAAPTYYFAWALCNGEQVQVRRFTMAGGVPTVDGGWSWPASPIAGATLPRLAIAGATANEPVVGIAYVVQGGKDVRLQLLNTVAPTMSWEALMNGPNNNPLVGHALVPAYIAGGTGFTVFATDAGVAFRRTVKYVRQTTANPADPPTPFTGWSGTPTGLEAAASPDGRYVYLAVPSSAGLGVAAWNATGSMPSVQALPDAAGPAALWAARGNFGLLAFQDTKVNAIHVAGLSPTANAEMVRRPFATTWRATGVAVAHDGTWFGLAMTADPSSGSAAARGDLYLGCNPPAP